MDCGGLFRVSLSSIRILDLIRALVETSCTRMFAELSAEVIKVEPAASSDMVRGISKLRGERSLYIIKQSLNKKICANLLDPEGLVLVKELVPHCYTVVENFKPGYDYIAQAYAGITSMIGEAYEAQHIPLAGIDAAMDRPELIDDLLFTTEADRLERHDEVVKHTKEGLATFADVYSAITTLENHGITCAPILSVEETLSYAHLVERGTVRTINDRFVGEFQILGMPIKSSAYPEEADYRAPTLGEHNREILRDFVQRNDVKIDALIETGVLASGEH